MTTEDRLKLLRATRVSDHPDILAAERELEEERRKLLASTRVSDYPDAFAALRKEPAPTVPNNAPTVPNNYSI